MNRKHVLCASAAAFALAAWGQTPAAAQQNEQAQQQNKQPQQQSKQAQKQTDAQLKSQQQAAQQSSSQDKMKVQDPIDLTTWAQAPLYDGIRIEDLFDADVTGPQGDDYGEIEDVVFSPKGKAEAVVIEAGTFLDIGDTHLRVPWDQVEIGPQADEASVPITEDNVEEYALFEGEYVPMEVRDWRATELIGDYATFETGVGYGYVDDLIVGQKGDLEAVVVMPDVTYGVHEPYAYPYYGYAYGWEPGLPYYELPYEEEEIAGLDPLDVGEFDD